MTFKVLTNIVVDGTPYRAGEIVNEDRIPAGSRRSLLRLKHFETVDETPPATPRAPAGKTTTKAETKRGRSRPKKTPKE